MKNKFYLSLSLAAIVVALLWWLWPRHAAPTPQTTAEPKPVLQPPSASTSASSANSSATKDDLNRTPLKGPPEAVLKRINEVRIAMDAANQPIRFYGKVIDQDGAPLSGVKVTLSVRRTSEVLPGLTNDSSDRFEIMTDEGGRFQLTDAKGALLGVKALEKAGYEASPQSMRYFWYYENENKKYRPDANTPEVFRMWKLAGAEKLARKSIGTRIPYDGRAVNFDLQTGREVASGGDIRVTLTRTPLQIKRGQDRYDWTATVEAIAGGVFDSSDEFMYRAPETGYESKLTVSVAASAPNWSADKEQSFYLKSRGNYSRVKVKFMTDSEQPTTGFSIETYTNPSGSRNLEYDPLQNVAKPTAPKP